MVLGVVAMLVAMLLAASAPASAQAVTYYGIDDGYGYGDTTASGDAFDPYGSTAAHPYLPFGTVIPVTGANGTEDVVVNDRCACELDVTKGVWERIGPI